MADLDALLANLSDNINVRGRQWERLCKWFLQNDPRYKSQLEMVMGGEYDGPIEEV